MKGKNREKGGKGEREGERKPQSTAEFYNLRE
jgi:hypothetical protein